MSAPPQSPFQSDDDPSLSPGRRGPRRQEFGPRRTRRPQSIPKLALRAAKSLGVDAFRVSWLRRAGFAVVAVGVVVAGYLGVLEIYSLHGSRTIAVCVSTDFEYRGQTPDWKARLKPVFDEVNRRFEGTGVKWLMKDGGESYSPGAKGTMLQRAVRLEQNSGCQADVLLGITGRGPANSSAAPPLSHVLLVQDGVGNDQARTAALLAQSLAGLFGAADNETGSGAVDPAKKFDSGQVRLIRAMRNYDFSRGAAALTAGTESRTWKALARSLAGQSPHPEAEAHRILAHAFAGNRQFDDSVRHLKDAVRLDPRNLSLRVDLAMAFEADSLVPEAIAELKEAAAIDPKNARPHAILGAILLNKLRADEAIGELEIAVRLDPKNAGYESFLGQAYSRQPGRSREASAAFEAAMRLRAADPLAAAGLARETGIEQSALQKVRDAESEVRQNPGSADAHLRLGLAHAEAGEIDEARKEIGRVLELRPNDGAAHLALARLDYLSGQYQAAASELNAARSAGAAPGMDLADSIQRKLGH